MWCSLAWRLALISYLVTYRQNWKPTKEHKFPLSHPQAPPGHEEVKEVWSTLFPHGSELLRKYLDMLAIETNHVESTFLLTDGVCLLHVVI